MGAYGAALLARQHFQAGAIGESAFRGLSAVAESSYRPKGFICEGCANNCEISELYIGGELAARWGSRCGRWDKKAAKKAETLLS